MISAKRDVGPADQYNTFDGDKYKTLSFDQRKNLYGALAKLGNKEWYETLKKNICHYIEIISLIPTSVKWSFWQLTWTQMIDVSLKAKWPFGLNTAEEQHFSNFLSDLNKLILCLTKNGYPIKMIPDSYYRNQVRNRNDMHSALVETINKLDWLFLDDLWNVFIADSKKCPTVTIAAESKQFGPGKVDITRFFEDTPPVVSTVSAAVKP